MNEELQSILASVLEKSMEVAEKTGQWALDMAPELIEQYLMWEFYSALFLAILGVMFISYTCIIFRVSFKKEWWDEYDKEPHCMFTAITGVVSIIVGLPMLLVSSYTMIFVSVAPEIYLIKNLL